MPPNMLRPPSPETTITEATQWVARQRSGNCSPEEQRAFLRWLNADETHGKAYRQADSLWQQLGGLNDIAGRQLHEARAHLVQHRRLKLHQRLAGAAVAAALGVVVWQADWLSYLDDQTYRTALGERKSVMLADGSRLDINTNSEVSVHFSRRGREVRLNSGQAAFAVAHGERPFDVFAGGMRVRDIGTQFDVRQRAGRIEVAVLEGKVEVAVRDGVAHPLHQGQRLSYDVAANTASIEPVDIAAAGAWRDGRIVFKSQSLGTVLAELGRYHSASVVVNSSGLLNLKISGAIPADDLEVALTTLVATLPATLTRTGPQSWRIDG